MDSLHLLIGQSGEAIVWWKMCLRAGLVFAVGVLMVRFSATRAFGRWSALDILLAVVVGSNLSRAMTGGAPFVPTLAATVVLIVLHGLVARAALQWSWVGAIVKGRAVRLVEDGEADEAAMRRAGIGRRDLETALRAQGHADLETVDSVCLERNGDITVVARATSAHNQNLT